MRVEDFGDFVFRVGVNDDQGFGDLGSVQEPVSEWRVLAWRCERQGEYFS